MTRILLLGALLLSTNVCNAQVIGDPTGKSATRLEPIEYMFRDSVGSDDVVIGVAVDARCRIGSKRIVQDLPNGCATNALRLIDSEVELQLMRFLKFDCRVLEVMLVFHCEYGD